MEVSMRNKVALAMIGIFVCSHLAAAAENEVSLCVDVAVPRKAVALHNGNWMELSSEQWQFLRGIYAMNPDTPPGLPYGDKAVLAQIDGNSNGLVFFIDGDKACTPMRAPPQLVELMKEVARGSIKHESAGL
jgi:hypothetical protein